MNNKVHEFDEEWIMLGDIPNGEFGMTSFQQNMDDMRIILEDEEHQVDIFFDGNPVLYRCTDEGIRMRTWGAAQRKYNDRYFFRKRHVFEVKNSALIEWCAEESMGFCQTRYLRHYCIVTGDDLIDIVASFEPKITVSSNA